MRKEAKLILISVSLILILSISFVSAGFFSDLWRKITGQTTTEPTPDITCTDSDGGNNIVEVGTTQWGPIGGNYYGSTDRCDAAGEKISEYSCYYSNSLKRDYSGVSYYTCLYGCENGKCILPEGESATCTDSDEGRDYYTKGTVESTVTLGGTDKCNGNSVEEYYCDGNGGAPDPTNYDCSVICCEEYEYGDEKIDINTYEKINIVHKWMDNGACSARGSLIRDEEWGQGIGSHQVDDSYCEGEKPINSCEDGACLGTIESPPTTREPNQTSTEPPPTQCAEEGEQFSKVFTDEYSEICCEGLTEWASGMDTEISIADTCYETRLMGGSPIGTCINCGNEVCEDIENPCNCPDDCVGEGKSDYLTTEEFCEEGNDIYCSSEEAMYLPLCKLCIFETQRNMFKYTERQVFLISDKNWKDVLQLVPVTTWTTKKEGTIVPTITSYPTLIFHEKSGYLFDADSIIYFMQQYSPDKVTIIGETPQELDNLLIAEPELGAGLRQGQIERIFVDDYLSYWDKFNDIVYVEAKYELGLMAATYASLINAPLVVIQTGGADYGGCEHECYPSGAKACSRNNILECQVGERDCLKWIAVETCDTGDICKDGQCITDPGTCECTGCWNGRCVTRATNNCNQAEGYRSVCDTTECESAPLCIDDEISLPCDCVKGDGAGYSNPESNPEQELNVICVGRVLPPEGLSCNEYYTLEQLQRKYIQKTHTDKVILVNYNDLLIRSGFFGCPEKSACLGFSVYPKTSLAAPILASARHELILSTTLGGTTPTDYEHYDNFLKSKVRSLGINIYFLTVMASPTAIPFRKHMPNLGNIVAPDFYKALDPTQYADFDSDNEPDIAVGRIMGMTISDVSSYVARSLSYTAYKNVITGGFGTKSKNMKFMGSSFRYCVDNAEKWSSQFKSAGYNALSVTNLEECYSFEPSEWENQHLISYSDHGAGSWMGIDFFSVPLLDNSIIFADACSTCATYDLPSFCDMAIRKGALAYIGSVSTAYGFNKIYMKTMNGIYYDNLLLGEAFHQAYYSKSLLQMPYYTTVIIGDPTLKINPRYMLNEKLEWPLLP